MKQINVKELEKQIEREYDNDAWPTTAWCPKCGLALVHMEKDRYFCGRCLDDYEFKKMERK